MSELSVKLCGVSLRNPVIAASGTFGFGREYDEVYDISVIGGVSTKGMTLAPRAGNPVPRIAEGDSVILNAVGLQNPGVEHFIKHDLQFLKDKGVAVIANVAGRSFDEYGEICGRLDGLVDFVELNISCPNVKEGGIGFGQDAGNVEDITKAVKRVAKQPVIMKLSPNVTDITLMAKAAEAGGADAISLINTLTGMKIDINRQTFALANRTGGLSGPAIKPVAVRMVNQVANAVKIPIIGMGGIATAEDALEFILAGASAVSVGTANFFNPNATIEIIDGIGEYMRNKNCQDINELIGIVNR